MATDTRYGSSFPIHWTLRTASTSSRTCSSTGRHASCTNRMVRRIMTSTHTSRRWRPSSQHPFHSQIRSQQPLLPESLSAHHGKSLLGRVHRFQHARAPTSAWRGPKRDRLLCRDECGRVPRKRRPPEPPTHGMGTDTCWPPANRHTLCSPHTPVREGTRVAVVRQSPTISRTRSASTRSVSARPMSCSSDCSTFDAAYPPKRSTSNGSSGGSKSTWSTSSNRMR